MAYMIYFLYLLISCKPKVALGLGYLLEWLFCIFLIRNPTSLVLSIGVFGGRGSCVILILKALLIFILHRSCHIFIQVFLDLIISGNEILLCKMFFYFPKPSGSIENEDRVSFFNIFTQELWGILYQAA